MSASVLIQPSFGNLQARKNYRTTLAQPIPFDNGALRDALSVAEYEHLLTVHPEGSARFWATSRNQDKIMSRVKPGDVVLFTGKGHVRAIGEVGVSFRNPDAGNALWPPQPKHGPYLNVYSLNSFQETEIPYTDLRKLTDTPNSNGGDNYMGARLYEGDRAARILDGLLIETATEYATTTGRATTGVFERPSGTPAQNQDARAPRPTLEEDFREGSEGAGVARSDMPRREGKLDGADRIERIADTDGEEEHESYTSNDFESSRERLVIAAVTNDLGDHTDHLGIDHDARALATLISSRQLQPPLAIGLYGEWGSGKTFFMKRVQSSIDNLQDNDPDDGQFHRKIEHVWFNAWHYARGNIWASLLEHIFTHLSPSESKPDSITMEALTHVRGMQLVLDHANVAVLHAQERVDELHYAVVAAEKNHKIAVERVGAVAITDLWKGLGTDALADAKLMEELKSAANSLGVDLAFDSAQELASAASEVMSLGSKTLTIAAVGGIKSPLAVTIYVALIMGGLGVGAVAMFDEMHSPVSAVLLQLGAVAGAIAAWVRRQTTIGRRILEPAWRVKKNADKRLAEQRRKLDAELETVKQDSAAAALALVAAKEQQEVAQAELAVVERAKRDLTGEQLLKSYLAERAGSGEYDHYLGVVGLAYRDLKDLSAFLERASKDEMDGTTALYRIVLYVDDLDRCDPETVVDVLDAVHLLLALPLFSVVVGVDPRWLASSLRLRHSELLGGNVAATAADYLEKIFHLTYTLPPMTYEGSVALLRASVNFVERGNDVDQYHGSIYSGPSASQSGKISGREGVRLFGQDSVSVGNLEFTADQVDGSVEGLTLSQADLEALDRIAPLVATSPRRAKRFMSAYLVIRARVLSDSRWRSEFNSDGTSPDSLALLVGLFLGVPKTMQEASKFEPSQIETVDNWVRRQISEVGERARLQAFIANAGTIGEVRMADVLRWEPVVAPYSGLHFALRSTREQDEGITSA